jgi:hypothetical protein
MKAHVRQIGDASTIKQISFVCLCLFASVFLWQRSLTQFKGFRYKKNAEGRTRTGTLLAQRGILSPLRLPIPPPRHIQNLQAMNSLPSFFSLAVHQGCFWIEIISQPSDMNNCMNRSIEKFQING